MRTLAYFFVILLGFSTGFPAFAAAPYVHFESGVVRPVALSPTGDRLFVTNVVTARLEVYDLDDGRPVHRGSIPVGLDPVAVAVRSAREVWVVNHLSDSISIVDVEAGRVTKTLLVGDEPRDLVFAGGRAFVTTAHRGQRRTEPELEGVPGAGDPRMREPGVPRADVWVFDAEDTGAASGGRPLAILEFFADTPRPLTVSADGSRVHVASFFSGNRTTVLNEGVVCDGFDPAAPCLVAGVTVPGGNPGPSTNAAGEPAPEVGLIVRHDGERWTDELGRDFSAAVRFDLPDFDVFSFDPNTLEATDSPVAHVGTTIFGLVENPVTGALYASNTEARNHVRFEGPGEYFDSTVRGNLVRSRVTVIRGNEVLPVDLNSHLRRASPIATKEEVDKTLSTPGAMVVSPDGTTLYVAAFGSSRIGVLPTGPLESGTYDPTTTEMIETSGGGPAGLVLDPEGARLFVYTRFDHSLAAIDLRTRSEVAKQPLPDVEPAVVRSGRRFLYDAVATSGNGEASCASCHVFGDTDHLAWDLGNPDDVAVLGAIPMRLPPASGGVVNGTGNINDFHPMKGPMGTQTLRGLAFGGAQHWRGDRSVGVAGADPFDARISFLNFNVAFPGLLGREEPLGDEDMAALADFVLGITLPPNPVRAFDGVLTPAQSAGRDLFSDPSRIVDGIPVPNLGFSCQGCHRVDPELGFFGTDGLRAFQDKHQVFKIPQLRNLYTKVGMFGMLEVPFLPGTDSAHMGPQIRGFGFLHDGSVDTIERFLSAVVFAPVSADVGLRGPEERENLAEYLLAFDSDLAPVVGQQITVDDGDAAGRARASLLLAAADRPFVSRRLGGATVECDVIAKQGGLGREVGYLWSDGAFLGSDGSSQSLDQLLEIVATGGPVTFTAVVPGTGRRLALDRDDDGVLDGVDACPDAPVCEERPREPDVPSDPPGRPPVATDPEGGCRCESAGVADRNPLGLWVSVGLVLVALVRRRHTVAPGGIFSVGRRFREPLPAEEGTLSTVWPDSHA